MSMLKITTSLVGLRNRFFSYGFPLLGEMLFLLFLNHPFAFCVDFENQPAASTIQNSSADNIVQSSLLKSLLTEALEKNPSLAALRAKLAAAREMVAPAGALPDPMVSVFLQDVEFPKITIGKAEMSMVGVEVNQGLLYPGKQKVRRESAQAEAQVQAAELDALQRLLASQVRILFARLYAVDREQESLKIGKELLEMLSATVAARYSAGSAEQEAVIKTQLETSRLTERMIDFDAERKTICAALNRLVDRPADIIIENISKLPEPVTGYPEPWEESAETHASEVLVRQEAVAAAERKVDVAKSDLNPNILAGAGVASRDSLDWVVTLRVGVELPLWRKEKQRPILRATEHELESAKQELRDAQAAARSEAARLKAEWQKSEEQIRRYREAIIPQSSAALDAARSSYLTGKGDFITVITDFNLWLEARVQLEKRVAERFMTWAELEMLLNPNLPVTSGEIEP